MALKAGRVGVAPSQVDNNGNVIGGGSSITVVDNLNSTSSTDALSAKQGKVIGDKLGGFEFRTHEGEAQYRTSTSGEWENFSSGVDGINLSAPVVEGLTSTSGTILEGGYQIVDGLVYVNILLDNTKSSSTQLSGLPNGSASYFLDRGDTGTSVIGVNTSSMNNINSGYGHVGHLRILSVYMAS